MPEDLERQSELLKQVVLTPQFQESLKELKSLPEDQRFDFVQREMSPNALRDKGVPVPDDIRITTRVFEDPAGDVVRHPSDAKPEVWVDPTPAPSGPNVPLPDGGHGHGATVCVSVGALVCASVGS